MAKVQFNRKDVLEQSTKTFWRLGYHATSMQIMFKETGLKPGSLYLAFGNKESLFRESLDNYTQYSLAKLSSLLSSSTSVEQGILNILIGMVDESCQADYCSCFLVKSQLELSDEPELQHYIAELLQQAESMYFNALTPIYGEKDAAIKAASVMFHIFGVRVYGYRSHSREQMIAALQVGLPWLPWQNALH